MKKVVLLLLSPALVLASASPVHCINIASGLYSSLSTAVEVSRTHAELAAKRNAEFVISKFDKPMVDSFSAAWRRVGNGTLPEESVVLILRMANGGYSARDLGSTHEHKQFTFRWHPATIAIVHTHPNSSSPKPQDEDLAVANKYNVPIFTITSRGMYVYDPTTKKITRVVENLDWLEVSKFQKGIVARQQ
jgi:hypothetical protein